MEEHTFMPNSADIAIVGAGPVGAVCALALKQGGLDPLVLEARTADKPLHDRRTLALSHGSRQILQRLGVWACLNEPTPITAIHVSHKGGLGRALLTAREEGVPALGYVLSYGDLNLALQQALQANQGERQVWGAGGGGHSGCRIGKPDRGRRAAVSTGYAPCRRRGWRAR